MTACGAASVRASVLPGCAYCCRDRVVHRWWREGVWVFYVVAVAFLGGCCAGKMPRPRAKALTCCIAIYVIAVVGVTALVGAIGIEAENRYKETR